MFADQLVTLWPYAILFLSVIAALLRFSRASLGLIAVTLLGAWFTDRVQLVSLALSCLMGAALWLPQRRELPRWAQGLCYFVFAVIATAMLTHSAPGFKNALIYDHVHFNEDSVPFTMYLNLDKTLVGLFIVLFVLRPFPVDRRHLKFALKKCVLLILLMLVLAPLSGYVRFDPKWPALAWLWALNNFFFVCLAEEAFFRGFIQRGLQRLFPKTSVYQVGAIVVAAGLFGLAHYGGGLSYVGFAFMAGLFYGVAYWRTDRIQVAMLVHFGLNLVHFILFSYPALTRIGLG